jgi:CHAT domain-containing protein
VYFDQGDYANAEPLFRRALEIDEALLGAVHPRLAVRLNGLAEVLRLRGEYQRAEPLYERVQSIREQTLGASHPQVADAWIARSLLRYASGDFAGAAALLSRGSELREETLALVLTAGSEDAKRQYLSKIADETDIAVSLHLGAAPESATAASLALNDIVQRKGRSLDAMADHLGNLRRRLDAADQDVLRQLSAARGRLAGLVLNGISTATQQEAAAKLRSDIQALEQTISARSAEFRAASSVATLGDIQRALPGGAVLIEFASYRPFNVHKSRTDRFAPLRYAAYVLSKTGIVVSVDLGEADRVDRDVERFRRALATPANQDAGAAGRALYQALIQPIETSLRGVEHVFVAPDGPLNLIPFAALVGADGKYLIESHTISYMTSGRDFMRLSGPANPPRAAGPPLVVANPSFDRDSGQASAGPADARLRFLPLPGTAAEAKALANVLPDARIYTGTDASETLLKEMRAPSVLHIATHGFFLRPTGIQTAGVTRGLSIVPPPSAPGTQRDDALVLSGLALAGANQRAGGSGEDGILTALEAASLDLWGTRLVVLSACETGVGEARNGEGVYGLRRALVLAGSESQVMSLWQVSDTATMDLMSAYYQRLRAGEGRAEALRNVQRRFLQSGSSRSHPFYWASFIQSGDWRAVFN